MSLNVSTELKNAAQSETLNNEQFISCIKLSLPRAWAIIEELTNSLRNNAMLNHAIHAPIHMEDDQRGQLLRLMASSSMRAAVENYAGLKLEFQNCHKTAAFRVDSIGSAEHMAFISPEAQILAQSPELRDC